MSIRDYAFSRGVYRGACSARSMVSRLVGARNHASASSLLEGANLALMAILVALLALVLIAAA